jgi:hypothetical protein
LAIDERPAHGGMRLDTQQNSLAYRQTERLSVMIKTERQIEHRRTFQMKRDCGFCVCFALILSCIITQTASAAELSSIKIQFVPDKLLAGQIIQLNATGTYSDGTTGDITSKATWSISNPKIGVISADGIIRVVESQGIPGVSESDMYPNDNFGGPDEHPSSPGEEDSVDGPALEKDFGPVGSGSEGILAGSLVTISASLDGIASPPISLTIMTAEGMAVYSQSGGTASKSKQTIISEDKNASGVKVTDKGIFTLSDSYVATCGNTTRMEYSDLYGLNAAVLALSGGKITMTNGAIITRGTSANGVFAIGADSVIKLSKVKIDCTASGAHGVEASLSGTVLCTDVDIKTTGDGAAAIATNRDGGIVIFTRGSVFTSGIHSPGIYSAGNISITDARIEATGCQAVVIEGRNSVTLANTILLCSKECGAMLYQRFAGSTPVGASVFTMTGGSFAASEGPLFYITNTQAVIEVKDNAKLSVASGILIKAAAGRRGNAGSNGGQLTFRADGEILTGDIVCDGASSIAATLQNKTILKGVINADNAAAMMTLTLDASSVWEVTGNSYLTGLTDTDTTLANIHGNGYTVYYDVKADANKWLGGKTLSLSGGGKLIGR